MNVVIWTRVSSREQREGYSIDAQLRACRDRATKNGWTAVREFAVAESAKRGEERLVFNEMFQWVRRNARKEKINAILAHKLDRVCRNMRDAVRLQELEDECGVQLAFVENQFGPGAAGALSFNVMAAVAQYYSDNLRTEVLKGIEERIRQGWHTGCAPYGYMNTVNKAEPVVPDPAESRALVRLFELFSTGHYSFAQVCEAMEKEGFAYRPDQPKFSPSALSHILNNRFYAGELVRNGTHFPGKHRLLFPRKLFEDCQDVLHGRNRRMAHQAHPMSGGIFRCGHCGYSMTGEMIHRKLLHGGVREHLYYRCANNAPPKEHPPVRWKEGDLEATIQKDLETIRMPEEIAEWFRRSIDEGFADAGLLQKQRKQALRKRKTELANMQERLLNTFLLGTIDEAAFQEKAANLKRQQAEVEEELGSDLPFNPEAPKLAFATLEFGQKAAHLWERSNWGVRKEILETVSLNRTISTASLCLPKRTPFDFLVERPFIRLGRGGGI